MNASAWLNEYMAAHQPDGRWTAEADWTCRLNLDAFRRTGDAACREYVLGWADAVIRAGSCGPECARALFFALAQKGDAAPYAGAIHTVMTGLGRTPSQEPMDVDTLCRELPFRMAYEMALGKMEKVGLVAAAFRTAHDAHYDAASGLYDGDKSRTARVLLALTDAIDACSDQLYEHWRSMVDLYRMTLRGALQSDAPADGMTQAMLVWAIIEGVRMKLIDPERYLPAAQKLIGAIRASGMPYAADMLEMKGGEVG